MQFYINNMAGIPLAAALFAVAAVFTIIIYRRHKLRRPWNYWLPTLRLAALALLLMSLLQPVFVHTNETKERGNIAVIIDNSGSMSISDNYSLPRQVEISAALQLFPQDLRNDGFGKSKTSMRRLVSEFRLLEKRLAGVEQDIRRKNENQRQRRINDVAVLLESGVTLMNEIRDNVVNSIERYPYLRPDSDKGKDKTKRGKTQRGLFYKRWERIEGWDVASLLNSPKFKRDPDRSELIPNFEIPRNSGTDIGVMVQGYVHPPRTGAYQFQFCSDDQGILYLSTNENPANKREICRTRTWATYKKFDAFPEQISKPIELEAGKSYYIEAYMKEHVGEDHLITGWRMPNGEVECPISGEHLTPFGIVEAGYGGPTFQSLFAEVSKDLGKLREQVSAMDSEFERASQIPDQRGQLAAIIALKKKVAETTKQMDDSWFQLGKLQNAADVALARSDMPDVIQGIKRFNAMKRVDLVKWVLTREPYSLQNKLAEKGIPRIYGLGDELHDGLSSAQLLSLKADLPRTDLGKSLGLVLKSFENKLLAGIIVFSDGNNNVRQNLREIREIAREREIPVIAVGVGSERPPRDIAIDSVVAPATSFRGDKTQLSVVLKRDGYNNQPVSLKIFSDQEMIHQKIVPPGSESRLTVDISFVEQRSGVLEYELEAQKFDDEEVRRNNVAYFKINILKDPIRVLLIDETPRWETRYCRMMLQRDRRFALNTVFVQSMGKDRDSSKVWFPSTGDLSTYQIVILGDVDPKHFSVKQLEDLRSFVVDSGGALILLAGTDFMPAAYMDTPLADVMPLSLMAKPAPEDPKPPAKKKRKKKAPKKEAEKRASTSIAIKTTAEGKYDPVIQIAETPELSARLWEQLPPLDWVHTGVIPSRTADTLVVTRDGNLPVVLRANIGLGRVLYLGSDSFWRWRYRAKWIYHHRLWGQLLLWGTIGRTTGSDRFVKFMTSRTDYTPGETVEITARILNESSLPLKNAHATVAIFDYKTNKIVRFGELDYIKDSGGKYIAHISGLPRGKYRATPVVQELGGRNASKAEAVFEIRDLPTSEYVDLALNPAGLKSFATQYVPYDQSQRIVEMIEKLEVPREIRDEWEVWDSFYMVIAAAILLGLEWFFRKRNQLV